MPNTASSANPTTAPAAYSWNPNGIITATMITACAASGTISFSARPISSDGRDKGVTRSLSWAPVWNSKSRFAPTVEVPNKAVITRIDGTNHRQTLPPRAVSAALVVAGPIALADVSDQPPDRGGLGDYVMPGDRGATRRWW